MTSHMLVDTRGHLLDRLLYAPLLGTLRGQLRDLGNRVVRQPDELTALADVRETVDQILRERSPTTDFRVLVEGALRHLTDLPALAQHPLQSELAPDSTTPRGTPLEQAAWLRTELDQEHSGRPESHRERGVTLRVGREGAARDGALFVLALQPALLDCVRLSNEPPYASSRWFEIGERNSCSR